jgi:hypothetical protein
VGLIELFIQVTINQISKLYPSYIIKQFMFMIDLNKKGKTSKDMIIIKQSIVIVNMSEGFCGPKGVLGSIDNRQ